MARVARGDKSLDPRLDIHIVTAPDGSEPP